MRRCNSFVELLHLGIERLRDKTARICSSPRATDDGTHSDRDRLPSAAPGRESLPHIHRLPIELLVEAFSWASDFVDPRTLLFISYTCNSWRAIMHHLPKIWARVPIMEIYDTLAKDDDILCPHLSRYVKLILVRCADKPLLHPILMLLTSRCCSTFSWSIRVTGRVSP